MRDVVYVCLMQQGSSNTTGTTTTSGTGTQDIAFLGPFDNNTVGVYRARVVARDQADADNKVWDVSLGFKVDGSGSLTITGNLQTLVAQGTGGALTWNVQGVANGSEQIGLRVGAALLGASVDWAAWAQVEYAV